MNKLCKNSHRVLRTAACMTALFMVTLCLAADQGVGPFIDSETVSQVVHTLIGKHGEALRSRIETGVAQAAALWREGDGSRDTFSRFCRRHFIAGEEERHRMLLRLEENLETIYGNLHRINRSLADPFELAEKKSIPLDNLFSKYNPSSHLDDMLYKTGVPFAVALNFPFYSLAEKLQLGGGWNRLQWAEAAAGGLYTRRVPPSIQETIEAVFSQFDVYQYNYNIHTGRLLDSNKNLVFKDGKKQISHWGLRDRLRAAYTETDGGNKQRALFQVMLRVVDQTIPSEIINSVDHYWAPESNTLYKKKNDQFVEEDHTREGGKRYHHWLEVFRSQKTLDSHDPLSDTLIRRSFEFDRQILEERVASLLLSILESPLKHEVGRIMKNRLKRPLKPFDIWYPGFKMKSDMSNEVLNKEVKARYPDARAFENDLPRILEFFGFSTEKSRFIAKWIRVDDSKGTGHALAPLMRTDSARLRVRIPAGGMDYIAYNFAVHELGHNVEQVCSLHLIDHYLLRGVPNIAITEAFAFLLGSRNLDLLGKQVRLHSDDPDRVLDTFLFTYKTSGVALLDMKTWRWLYDHPLATVEELQGAVLKIAKSIWNRYYGEVFGTRDVPVLAVYTHLIGGVLYFPDYPLGQIISFQIEDYIQGKNLGTEMERMCRIGSVTPDLWMQRAVGAPISTKPLLEATAAALRRLK